MIYDPNFHEVEYFFPIEHAREIMDRMRELMLRWLPLSLYPLEIRVVARDDGLNDPTIGATTWWSRSPVSREPTTGPTCGL